MPVKVLVTGGAGFIGGHLVSRLLREGCTVSVLDNFSSQIHGTNRELPSDLVDHVELYRADVRDKESVSKALVNCDILVHLAAETGTGQSMYEVCRYQDVNLGGMAAVVDCIVNQPRLSVRKIVLASSRAVYGEGKYRCSEHGIVYPEPRTLSRLSAGVYEPVCPICSVECAPEATSEDSPTHPLSFYGLTKLAQEQMVSMFTQARGLAARVLRYQNVFGPGQALRNPYTGILAIFSNLARSGRSIQVFEDGCESRDFVFVEDAVEATWRCIAGESTGVETFNVGTGQRTTVLQVAQEIMRYYGDPADILITGVFRQGDVRHNFADLHRMNRATGYIPCFALRDGLHRFLQWATTRPAVLAGYESSLEEMFERGLIQSATLQTSTNSK